MAFDPRVGKAGPEDAALVARLMHDFDTGEEFRVFPEETSITAFAVRS